MGTLIKGMIGKQDLEIQYNTNATETFSRTSSAGGTLSLDKFPDIWTGLGKINVASIASLTSLTSAKIIMADPWADIRYFGQQITQVQQTRPPMFKQP